MLTFLLLAGTALILKASPITEVRIGIACLITILADIFLLAALISKIGV